MCSSAKLSKCRVMMYNVPQYLARSLASRMLSAGGSLSFHLNFGGRSRRQFDNDSKQLLRILSSLVQEPVVIGWPIGN